MQRENAQYPESLEHDEQEKTKDKKELEGAAEVMEEVDELARSIEIQDFTAIFSKRTHGHAPNKHNAVQELNLNPDFVSEYFVTMPSDHAALWELHYRKQEFIDKDENIFTDVPNDDTSRWKDIERLKKSARIKDEIHRELKSL